QTAFRGRPIHLHFAFAIADDSRTGEISFLTMPHHLRAAHTSKGTQRCEQIDRFENICFPLRILAEQKMKTWAEIHVQPRVVAEITKAQMSEMHPSRMRWERT